MEDKSHDSRQIYYKRQVMQYLLKDKTQRKADDVTMNRYKNSQYEHKTLKKYFIHGKVR